MARWIGSTLLRHVAEGILAAAVAVPCCICACSVYARADKVRLAGIVLLASALISGAIPSLLAKLNWIDKTALKGSAAPALMLPPPLLPPLPPIAELDSESTIVESESVEALITDFDQRVEIAVQKSVIRDVARHEGVKISFAPIAANHFSD